MRDISKMFMIRMKAGMIATMISAPRRTDCQAKSMNNDRQEGKAETHVVSEVNSNDDDENSCDDEVETEGEGEKNENVVSHLSVCLASATTLHPPAPFLSSLAFSSSALISSQLQLQPPSPPT